MTFSQINVGTGELERYPDATVGISEALADEAAEAEAIILGSIHATEVVYLRLGELMADFEERELYKARGYASFRQWADSADMNRLNYQTAQNLIRIHKGLKPIFERGDLNIEDYPMSALRALLPLLGDYTDDDILQVARDVHGLTVKDTNAVVKEKRGIKQYPEPVVFKARVQRMDIENKHENYRFTVACIRADGSVYSMGPQQIVNHRDYAALKKFYGRHIEEV